MNWKRGQKNYSEFSRDKKVENTEERLRIQANKKITSSIICFMSVPERREKKNVPEAVFEEKMVEKFPELMKDTNSRTDSRSSTIPK